MGALPLVRSMAADRAVVTAVVEQNARQLTPAWLQQVDREWMATRGVNDIMRRHIDSPCGQALRAASAQQPAVVEAFAMDGQGALVCTMAKTTDYFQGDEPKWQRAFAGGRGAEFVDAPEWDESSQGYTIQVSVPVKDRDRVVGALTVGFDLDRLGAPEVAAQGHQPPDPKPPEARPQDHKPQDASPQDAKPEGKPGP
jgi:hypothetical protein